MVNFEVAIAMAFSEIIERKKIFPDAEVGGCAGGINAICSGPEVANDVFSGYTIEPFRDYHSANL